MRRLGRRWVATPNLVMIVFSAVLFLYVVAITSLWVSDTYSLFGLTGGCLLGLLGLALTRWEQTPQAVYYTPNRWLILIITLAVTARLLYGVWRPSAEKRGFRRPMTLRRDDCALDRLFERS